MLEKSESARTKVGTLMYNVIKQKKFKVESFTEALKNTLECAEDMVIDVPKIATYLAQIIAPMFATDISIEFLSEACEPIKDKPICADFISEVMISASKRFGHSTAAVILQKDEVVLKKTETPYIIKKLAMSTENVNEEEELFRETRNILNKLTPQNLQKLTASLINLPITTEHRLKGCIDIIFEKAIDEQVFSQTYGQLSKVLSQVCY